MAGIEGHHEGEHGTRSSPLVIGSPGAGSVTGSPASRHLVPPGRSSGRAGPSTASDYHRQRASLDGGAGLGGVGSVGGSLTDQAREAVQRASIVAAAAQYGSGGGDGGGGAQVQDVYSLTESMMGRRDSGAGAGAGGSGYHLSDALLSREVARERAAAAAAASAAATVAIQEKRQRADAVAAAVAQQLYRGSTDEEQLAQLRQQQEGAAALLLKQAEGRMARKRQSESAAAVAAAAAAAAGGAGLYGVKRSRLLDAGGLAGYSQTAASRYYPSPSSSAAGASPSLRPQQRQQDPSPLLSGIEAAVGGSKSEDILKHQRLVNQVLSTAAARKAAGNRPSSSAASTSSSPTHKPMEKPSPSVSSHASAPPEGLDPQDLGKGAPSGNKAAPASSPPSAQRQRQQYVDRFNPTPGAANDGIRRAKDATSLEVEVMQEGQQQQPRSSPQLKPDKPGGERGLGMNHGGGSIEDEGRSREEIIADVNRMIKQARSGKTTQPASSTSHATTTEMLRAKAADAAAAAAATLNQPAVAAAAAAAAVSLPPGGGAKAAPGANPGTGDGTPISWRGRGPVSVELTHSQRAALERTSFFRDDASLIRELSLWEGGMPREGVVKALRRSLLMTCLPQANIPEAEAAEIVKCFL